MITDSGGVTEEAKVIGVPCITLCDNSDPPETIILGTNELIGTDSKNIAPFLDILYKGKWKNETIHEKWDGKAGPRIVEILSEI